MLLFVDCITDITERREAWQKSRSCSTTGKGTREGYSGHGDREHWHSYKRFKIQDQLSESLERNTHGLKILSLTNAEVQPRYPIRAVKQDTDLGKEGSQTRFPGLATHERQATSTSVVQLIIKSQKN